MNFSKRRLLAVMLLLAGIILLGGALLGTSGPTYAQDDIEIPELDDPVLQRGQYIVRAAGACVHCHAGNGDDGPAGQDLVDSGDVNPFTVGLAGGGMQAVGNYAFQQPYGMVASPNLTTLQDWSDEELEIAIRYGIDPDGTVLLRPMPYIAYENMSDADMEAVIAYLRTLEPIENEVPEPQLNPGISREDTRVPHDIDLETEREGPGEDADPVAVGEYLATAVSACVHCHGSVDNDGDPVLPLAGETWLYDDFNSFQGPSLLSENLDFISDEAILELLDYSEPLVLMPSSVYRYMTDEDHQAILEWLRTQP
ncbi:MAG: c-type cytochrome [Anaerolineales bacterium]